MSNLLRQTVRPPRADAYGWTSSTRDSSSGPAGRTGCSRLSSSNFTEPTQCDIVHGYECASEGPVVEPSRTAGSGNYSALADADQITVLYL
ncbi:hydroxylamine reductase [Anopheles sinensis]|uniref:Hydroxylamine reductase n=1 Tax=Anopheles sinensis TaxID=74873 RepID=A0A084VQ57_ANOSI|nr:hydroxylamine reductase [Anopheles sinensis]